MTKDEIFSIIRSRLQDILPDIDPDQIMPEESMRDLGADSVERADVIIETMEELELKIPLNELGGLKNLQELVDFLHARIEAERA